jgi:hypothetical protein
MLDQTIVTYCICDEVCKGLAINDDPQCKMSTAEVMTFAILAASMFYCDYRRTRMIAQHSKMFTKILSHSQLVRRIHSVPDEAWHMAFQALRKFLQAPNQAYFIVDSFPLEAFQNHKSRRAKRFSGKEFHGYSASKKRYFFGIKVHMIVDKEGVPVEFLITPGSVADIRALWRFTLDLPAGSTLYGDKAYTHYQLENLLYDVEQIKLVAKRKQVHKKQHSPETVFGLSLYRNRIETVFSSITGRLPRHLRATSEKGFILKVLFCILAYMIEQYYPMD